MSFQQQRESLQCRLRRLSDLEPDHTGTVVDSSGVLWTRKNLRSAIWWTKKDLDTLAMLGL